MTTVKLYIGQTKFKEFIFNDNDKIKLKPKHQYNLYLRSHSRKGYTITFVYKDNGSIITKSSNIGKNKPSDEQYNKIKTDLRNKYDIIDKLIDTASNISKMDEKILNMFNYIIPEPIEYDNIEELPVDPYYIGFWLGDGTTSSPGGITIGGETKKAPDSDQPFILPYITKHVAKKFGLKLIPCHKKGSDIPITFRMSNGLGDEGKKGRNNSTNNCLNDDWLDDVLRAILKLQKSKENLSPRNNFQKQYDPFISYKQEDGNYKCHHKSMKQSGYKVKKNGDNDWIYFDNMREVIEYTKLSESSIYKSINNKKFIRDWIVEKNNIEHECECNYTTSGSKRSDCSLEKSRQYAMREHIQKNHKDIKIEASNKVWKRMSDNERKKYKISEDKCDIYKSSKYLDSISLWEMNKIYEEEGIEGLIKYKQDVYNSCNKLILSFRRLGIFKKKIVPELYKKSSIEDRKKLLAGLIDSDGGREVNTWDITVKSKEIIDGAEEIAKSLGMFTYRTTRQSRAKKKDGTYSEYITCHRLKIIPFHNKDLPILLERKKIVTEEIINQINIKNKPIAIDKEWTQELKDILYKVVTNYKKKNNIVFWKMIRNSHPELYDIRESRLKGMYGILNKINNL